MLHFSVQYDLFSKFVMESPWSFIVFYLESQQRNLLGVRGHKYLTHRCDSTFTAGPKHYCVTCKRHSLVTGLSNTLVLVLTRADRTNPPFFFFGWRNPWGGMYLILPSGSFRSSCGTLSAYRLLITFSRKAVYWQWKAWSLTNLLFRPWIRC